MKKTQTLTPVDFVFVKDPELGQTYQKGPYTILVGRGTYSAACKGQTFSWGLESITEAVGAVERHSNGNTPRGLAA
jgi:hypothetical protein